MRHYLDLGVGVGDLRRPVRPLSWARNDRHHLQAIKIVKWDYQEETDTMLRNLCSSVVIVDTWHFTDPYIWLTDPDSDPALSVSDLQDANKNYFFSIIFLPITFWRYIYIILQKKVIKKSQNSKNRGFSNYFWLIMEGSWPDPDPYPDPYI